MTDFIFIISSFAGGLFLGGLYFGGLWLTVRKLRSMKYPIFLVIAGFLVRMAILLVGCYIVSGATLQGLLSCLAGIMLSRVIVMSLTRLSHSKKLYSREVTDDTY